VTPKMVAPAIGLRRYSGPRPGASSMSVAGGRKAPEGRSESPTRRNSSRKLVRDNRDLTGPVRAGVDRNGIGSRCDIRKDLVILANVLVIGVQDLTEFLVRRIREGIVTSRSGSAATGGHSRAVSEALELTTPELLSRWRVKRPEW
jgi:hypothetical protein